MKRYFSRNKLSILLVLFLSCILCVMGQVKSSAFEEGVLCAGKPWATPYYLLEGQAEGPTVVIVGGTHGDERAGLVVVRELCDFRPDRGRLVLIPEANRRAVVENVREVAGEGNLNRCYPGRADGLPMEQVALAIFRLFEEIRPDLVLDLHESEHFHRNNPDYVGQTLIAAEGEESIWYGMLVVERLNQTIMEWEEQFTLLHQPVQGSTAWAAGTLLNIPAYTVETCQTMSFDLRKQYQHLVIEHILHEFGVNLVCNSTY